MRYLLLATFAALPSFAAAQTSTATIQDSLYRLAVDPKDHPDDPYVWLLDEGKYSVEADGHTKNTVRQVVQILKPQGASFYRERVFSWNPERQKLTVNWMRVVKPGGEVISDRPEQIQDSDVPAQMGVPMYTAAKVRRMSLSGLDSGTILDFSVTTESDAPLMKGDFYEAWRVTTPTYVVRSNLELDVPVAMHTRIIEHNLDFKRTETVANGRRTYAWRKQNVDKFRSEPWAPDSIKQGMSITVSPSFDWDAIGKWYVPIARGAYAVTPSVEEKMKTVLAGAKNLDDSIAKIHKWVTQDIRYVAIELGRGGYVPRSAETVVRTGFGDCKDKAMLFAAALGKMGVTAYPVLLNINGAEQKETPSVTQFNHMIAAVKRGKGYVFSDLTAGSYPFGILPRSEQGALAVLVKENGAEQITLPEESSSNASAETLISGQLAEDGVFSGHYDEALKGYIAPAMRMLFQTTLDSTRREFLGRSIAGRFFQRAETDSLLMFDGKDLNVEPRISLRITRAKIMSTTGDVMLLNNPLRPLASYSQIADGIEKETKRRLPYDMSKLAPQSLSRTEVRIKLPRGWTATLPESTKIDGPLVKYEVSYTQVGDELRMMRSISGSKAIVPASQRMDIVRLFRTIGSDEGQVIVIKGGQHSVATR
jgi:hypothetical protein